MPSYSAGATGVPASNKFPGVMIALTLGAQPASIGGTPLKVLVIGNKTAAGTMINDSQVYKPTSVDDAQAAAGTGSELALMTAAAMSIPGATVYMLANAPPTGVQASATLTIANAATGSGNYTIWIHGFKVVVGITSGQSLATIVTNVVNAISAKTANLCVTVSGNTGTGVITITWRHTGTRGNACTIRQKVDATVTGTTFTLSGATLSGGTGTEDLTNAIATIANGVYHRIAVAQGDSTALGLFKTHLESQGGALVGRHEQLVFMTTASLGTATSLVQTLNEPLMQALWHPSGEDIPGVVAAGWAAKRAVAEADAPAVNLSSWNMPVAAIPGFCNPQSDPSLYCSNSSATSALDVGLTPIQVAADGTTYVVRSITTHSQDASGNPDWRVLDTVNVSVPQAWADDLSISVPQEFQGKNLVDDPADSDDELPNNATTPSRVQSFCYGRAQAWEKFGWMTNVEADAALWAFNLAASSPGRVNADMQIHPAQWFVQFSANVRALSA